jgi:SAM-dependent methyltransferase
MTRLRSTFSKFRTYAAGLRRTRIIVDHELVPNALGQTNVGYDTSLRKEALAREYIFGMPGDNLKFLDVGGGDGELTYLFGITDNLRFDKGLYEENRARFAEKYTYYGVDLAPGDNPRMLSGDVCDQRFSDTYSQFHDFFDVIYSNNVFEHLRRPWIAAKNLLAMLRPGGICITVAPFSLRYHEVPGDYFRYTHTCLPALFADAGPIRTLSSGYDTTGRRNNWQGLGDHNDTCPVDHFGAWRENWFVITVVQKVSE